jgi:hypothetical protein
MASLKFETFLGDIPFHDATLLPEQNSRQNRDCWFVNGKLQPIKEAAADGSIPSGTQTLYRYRPCPKDASQAYWITRSAAYNVAPSPIPNDKYGRLYFTRKKYTVGETVELPHFYDVKGLLGRTANTDLCTNNGDATGPYPLAGGTKYTLGVPTPASATAELTSGYTPLGVSTDGLTWTPATNFVGTSYAFQTVGKYGSIWLAGGYNGTIATSTDGETWTTASTPLDAEKYVIRCFAVGTVGSTTVYIAGCDGGKLLTSLDGSAWDLSPTLGVAVSGNILAAVFWDGCFWIGTGTGKTYRTLNGDTVGTTNNVTRDPTQENAWREATGPSTVFAGQGISDAVIWRSRPYFVGGGGLLVAPNGTTRAATTAWSNQGDGGITGTYRTIRVAADGGRVVAVTDAAYVTATSTAPTIFSKVTIAPTSPLGTIFKGGKIKAGAYGPSGNIILVGTNGIIALFDSTQETWTAPTADNGVGKTPLNSVEYADGKYVVAGGSSTAISATSAPRYYAITMIDGFGAESAPVLTGRVDASDGDGFNVNWGMQDFAAKGWTVNLTGAKFYIYRTASSGTTTDFLLVDEVDYVDNQTEYSYKDNKTDDTLGEVMMSTDWIMPPTGLRGLVSLPGGVLAGFVDNTLWFSEPGQPQAWPTKYQRTVSAPIVGLSTFANSVLITTIDRSYVASGIDPFNMSLTELETDQSCISAESVVDMGGYAIYATPRGLVKVSNMSPEWLTRQLFKPDQWAELTPATMRATLWEGRYLAFFDGTPTYAASGVHSFSIVPGGDVDGVAWYSQAASIAFTDPYDDRVYMIEGTSRKIWNAGNTYKTFLWRSKTLQSPESLSFGWLQAQLANESGPVTVRYFSEEGYVFIVEATIQATDHITRQSAFTMTVFAPDHTVTASYAGTSYDATVRLPAGRRTRFHIMEIESSGTVRQVLFTQSAEELHSQ